MKRCAIYARYSSDLQAPTSIDDQVALCRARAAREGWTVVGTYADAAISGAAAANRPEYQRLRRDALSGGFDLIVVEDLSRLARDQIELLVFARDLAEVDVEIVGVSDGVQSGGTAGTIHVSMKALFGQVQLADLRDKTHRGEAGQVRRGFSAGGRTFGYRSVKVDGGSRLEVDPAEAEIVRRIFGDYLAGRSFRAIAHRLNDERIPFPTKPTKRGPVRMGWAMSSVRFILGNERYVGLIVWNRTRFVKDPRTGRRRPRPRPESEWIRIEHPELRIIDDETWYAVRERLGRLARRTAGSAFRAAYSPYLLTGLLRCGVCNARMVAQTQTRRKGKKVYRQGWYRCSYAATKGPAVCTNGTWYPQDRLEGLLVERFREATTPEILAAVADLVNEQLAAAASPVSVERRKAEVADLQRQAKNLVVFLAGGGSAAVRAELAEIEHRIAGLSAEISAVGEEPLRAHPAAIAARVRRLVDLLRTDPAKAKAGIMKHLDGDLLLDPEISPVGEKRIKIRGAVKANSLLGASEEAACRKSIAGGRSALSVKLAASLPWSFRAVL